jgi:CheY-like chemotaxis protein
VNIRYPNRAVIGSCVPRPLARRVSMFGYAACPTLNTRLNEVTVSIRLIAPAKGTMPSSRCGAQLAKKIILIADDNPVIRKMLCRMFEAEADFDLCAEAVNGAEAIALALKHRPELIVLDLSMPVLNGIDAARELKKLMPSVPIILFTEYSDLGNSLSRDRLQVDRIVSKMHVTELMAQVRSLLPV